MQTFALVLSIYLFMTFDNADRQCTGNEQHASHNHHIALMRTNQTQNSTTADGSHNLRNTDGSVEQAQVCAHVAITLQSIGHESERHRQHGSPAGTNHQEWNKLQILIVQEWDESEAHTTYNHSTACPPCRSPI